MNAALLSGAAFNTPRRTNGAHCCESDLYAPPPPHPPSANQQVWAELEGPKTPSLQEVCAAAAKGPAGTQAFLSKLDESARSVGHEKRIIRMLDELPKGVVVVVACQGVSPELPRKLDKQRKACEDRRCASVWTKEQGKVLLDLEGRARDGCAFFVVT